MDVIYSLLPGMIMLALVSVAVFFWAARSGQYEDMQGPAHRILSDDDDPLLPPVNKSTESALADEAVSMENKKSLGN